MDFSPHSEFRGTAPTLSHTAKDSTSGTPSGEWTFPRAQAFLPIHHQLCRRSLPCGEKRKVRCPRLAHAKQVGVSSTPKTLSVTPEEAGQGEHPRLSKIT